MLKALLNLSERMGLKSRPPDFNPEVFNDPVALLTSWSPLKGGGSNFRTQKLVEIDPDRMEIRTTMGAALCSSIFFVAGLFIIGIGIKAIISCENVSFDVLFPLFLGLLFSGAGGVMFVSFSMPAVFDRRNGYFWKGRKSPAEVVNKSRLNPFAEFEQIHALQLISEYCASNKSSYYSYELNLVLKDGNRINVFDHGRLEAARTDAEKLSVFLKRPLWDAILR